MTAGPRANYSQTLNDGIITDSDAQVHLRAVVQDEHQCTTNTADDVRNETLEQARCETFFSGNLLETMHGALVQMLLDWLLRLHLQTTAHGVERVGGTRTDRDCSLCRSESGEGTHETLVLLPWIQASDGVETTELQTAVTDDAHHGHSETGVQGHRSSRACSGLLHAI